MKQETAGVSHEELLDILDNHFSEEELRTLCFSLAVEYADLPALGRFDKARELIKYLVRRGQIPTLIEICKQSRPDLRHRLNNLSTVDTLRASSQSARSSVRFPPAQSGASEPSSMRQLEHIIRSTNKTVLVFGGISLLLILSVLWTSGFLPSLLDPQIPPTTVEDLPTATLTGSPTQNLEATNTPVQMPSPTTALVTSPTPISNWSNLGKSVRGRDLSLFSIGNEGGTAVVIVGGIQGDQPRTSDLVSALIADLQKDTSRIPETVAFHLFLSGNPDGQVSGSRFNANDVDLNRNWDTKDWTSNAPVPGYPNGKPGAGGERPFSEPETRALSNFLLLTKSRSTEIRVVVLHSSVSSPNEVYYGGERAEGIADEYASVSGYKIGVAWGAYTPTGELVTWCDEQRIAAIDVVIPADRMPSIDRTIEALIRVAEYP